MAAKKRHGQVFQQCPNCGHSIQPADQFCAQCGQRTHDLHLPLKHLAQEVFEDLFHFEHRSLQTLKKLVFAPGTLTKEFIAGKRMSYVAPIRFYVFISVLFFFLLSLPSHQKDSAQEHLQTKTNISFLQIQSSHLSGIQISKADSILTAEKIEATPMNRYIVRQLIRFQNEGEEKFYHLLLKTISYMMFLLMPVFAAVVFLFYRKQAQHYIGTLIFSVHYHTFLFVVFIFVNVIDRMWDSSWVLLLAMLLCPVYLYCALRHVYGGSILGTILKTFGIGVLQTISLLFMFAVTMAISMLLL
jgi:Protein of unknown function (DUF3667)/zinc-ribbon domain